MQNTAALTELAKGILDAQRPKALPAPTPRIALPARDVDDDERLTRLLLRQCANKMGIGAEIERDFGPLAPEARDKRLLDAVTTH